jgi:hypothetical protein
MLKQAPLLMLLAGLALAQAYPEIHYEQLDEIRTVGCKGELPEGYSCGILLDLDLPPSSMIVSVVGGVIRQLSVAINGTIYTAVCEPPLERDDKFAHMGKNARIPARVVDNVLTIRWPDGTEAKGKIFRREHVSPDRPQPA